MHDLEDLQRIARYEYLQSRHSRLNKNISYLINTLGLLAFAFGLPPVPVLKPLSIILGVLFFLILLCAALGEKISERYLLTRFSFAALSGTAIVMYIVFSVEMFESIVDNSDTLKMIFSVSFISGFFSLGRLMDDWENYQFLKRHAAMPPPARKTQDYYTMMYNYLTTVKPDNDPEVFTFAGGGEGRERFRAKIAGNMVIVYSEKEKNLQFILKDSFVLQEIPRNIEEKLRSGFSRSQFSVCIRFGSKVLKRAFISRTDKEKFDRLISAAPHEPEPNPDSLPE